MVEKIKKIRYPIDFNKKWENGRRKRRIRGKCFLVFLCGSLSLHVRVLLRTVEYPQICCSTKSLLAPFALTAPLKGVASGMRRGSFSLISRRPALKNARPISRAFHILHLGKQKEKFYFRSSQGRTRAHTRCNGSPSLILWKQLPPRSRGAIAGG